MNNVKLCSGFGKFHTDNANNTNSKPYDEITINEIFSMVINPTHTAKDKAQWVILSTLKSRVSSQQFDNGEFYGIWGDIDENTELNLIKDALNGMACIYAVYSSSRATIDLKKWRIFIPLAYSATAEEFTFLAQILNERLLNLGITPDIKNTIPNQIFYLPNCDPVNSKFYHYFIIDNLPLLEWRETFKDELANKFEKRNAEQAQLIIKQEKSRLKAIKRLESGVLSPIDAYKENYPVENNLLFYGYKKIGIRWLSPNSRSGKAGVIVVNNRWISEHSSDSNIGKAYNSGTSGDAFDLFVYYEHGGDFNAALIAAGRMFSTSEGLSITQLNQSNFNYKRQQEYIREQFDDISQTDGVHFNVVTDITHARVIIQNALELCKESPAVLFEAKFCRALQFLKINHLGEFKSIRCKIKDIKPSGVSMSDIDALTHSTLTYDQASVASELIQLSLKSGQLYFDAQTDKSYIDVKGQIINLESKAFIDWLSREYYTSTRDDENGYGQSASEQNIKQARFTLSGMAKHDGHRQSIYLRSAIYDENVYIFIGNESREIIEVTKTGWQVINEAPVKFWQSSSMQSLPKPDRNGDIDLLWNYVNVSEKDRLLVLAWLLETFRNETPYPILAISGQQGSAKSSSQDKLKQLFDNNSVNLRAAPKSIEDIFVSAGSNLGVSYENLSHLNAAMQDALCTLATGGGFASRKFYTNDEENIIAVKRPVIINSIPNVITAQDLTDRAISIEAPRVSYQEESLLNKKWDEDKSIIFGGLMDLFVKTLAGLKDVKLAAPPRMADFTRLGESMARALGHDNGYFTHLYRENRSEGMARSLESSPVAIAIIDMVERHKGDSLEVFYGTVKALYDSLSFEHTSKLGWPRSAKGLSEAIKRQQPALKDIHIRIEFGHKKERIKGHQGFPIKIIKTESFDDQNFQKISEHSDFYDNDDDDDEF